MTNSIDDVRAQARELLARLRTERDDLHVRMHLAGAELRDEWQRVEPKWQHFQARAEEVAASAGEASKDVGAALVLLGEELGHAFERIRKSFD